jgi:hypothetical protein
LAGHAHCFIVGESKKRIAMDVRQNQRRLEPRKDDLEQGLQNALGMIKLAAGQKSGVARNVGNQQVTALRHGVSSIWYNFGINRAAPHFSAGRRRDANVFSTASTAEKHPKRSHDPYMCQTMPIFISGGRYRTDVAFPRASIKAAYS